MIKVPGRSTASSLLLISIYARLFWGMSASAAPVHIAAWLCPFAGLLLFLPLWIAEAACARKAGSLSPWQYLQNRCPSWLLHAVEILLALLLLLDCAFSMRVLAGIANILALNNLPIWLLLLPPALMLALTVQLGAEACGNSARLWNHLLPLLFTIIFLIQLPHYEPGWLTPVLGGGAAEILRGAIYCSGSISLLSTIWLNSAPDRKQRAPLKSILIAATAVSFQLAAFQMLAPAQTGMNVSRAGRIALVLSNGRTPISLQLLLMLISYGSLLQLIASEGTACASFLSNAFRKCPRWPLSVGIAAATLAIATGSFSASHLYAVFISSYLPLFIVLAAITALSIILERSKKACAKHF